MFAVLQTIVSRGSMTVDLQKIKPQLSSLHQGGQSVAMKLLHVGVGQNTRFSARIPPALMERGKLIEAIESGVGIRFNDLHRTSSFHAMTGAAEGAMFSRGK